MKDMSTDSSTPDSTSFMMSATGLFERMVGGSRLSVMIGLTSALLMSGTSDSGMPIKGALVSIWLPTKATLVVKSETAATWLLSEEAGSLLAAPSTQPTPNDKATAAKLRLHHITLP